ncbi:hypothetical protein CF319_g7024 [Tilletia indica]|nr:hypothetical protein CF319_g7024 [Tilletia indica]
MAQTPSVSRLLHVRMISMLSTIALVDLAFVAWSLETIYLDSKQLALPIIVATEFMALFASNFSIGSKYFINCINAYSDDVWEKKSMYVFYLDLLTDFIKLLVYTLFPFILATYGFPFKLAGDVIFTVRSFLGRVRDWIRYREATQNMHECYPDASMKDMEAFRDGTGITVGTICSSRARRELHLVNRRHRRHSVDIFSTSTACGLGCLHSLRSWLER